MFSDQHVTIKLKKKKSNSACSGVNRSILYYILRHTFSHLQVPLAVLLQISQLEKIRLLPCAKGNNWSPFAWQNRGKKKVKKNVWFHVQSFITKKLNDSSTNHLHSIFKGQVVNQRSMTQTMDILDHNLIGNNSPKRKRNKKKWTIYSHLMPGLFTFQVNCCISSLTVNLQIMDVSVGFILAAYFWRDGLPISGF